MRPLVGRLALVPHSSVRDQLINDLDFVRSAESLMPRRSVRDRLASFVEYHRSRYNLAVVHPALPLLCVGTHVCEANVRIDEARAHAQLPSARRVGHRSRPTPVLAQANPSDVAAPRSLSRLSWVSRPTRPRARAGCTGEAALGAVRSCGGPVRVKYLPTYLKTEAPPGAAPLQRRSV